MGHEIVMEEEIITKEETEDDVDDDDSNNDEKTKASVETKLTTYGQWRSQRMQKRRRTILTFLEIWWVLLRECTAFKRTFSAIAFSYMFAMSTPIS